MKLQLLLAREEPKPADFKHVEWKKKCCSVPNSPLSFCWFMLYSPKKRKRKKLDRTRVNFILCQTLSFTWLDLGEINDPDSLNSKNCFTVLKLEKQNRSRV